MAKAISRVARIQAARREGVAPRRTREGASTAWPDVRVKPVAPPARWPRASTRPRWPVDAPITPKTANVFLHPPRCLRGRVGRGLFRRRLRHVVGHRCPVYEGSERDRQTSRGRVSPNAQGHRGRPGPMSDGRTPAKQAPAHLAARATSARAKRTAIPQQIAPPRPLRDGLEPGTSGVQRNPARSPPDGGARLRMARHPRSSCG